MKKKILSPEALAALAAGKTFEAKAEVDGAGETTETVVEAAAETSEETEQPDFAGQIEALTAEKTELQAQVATLTETISGLEAATIAVDAKIKAASDEVEEYKAIVVGHIAAMRIGLSLSAVDMANWTAEAILREYSSVSKSFEKSFAAGSRVPETPAKKEEVVPAIASSHDAAGYASLGFK